MRWIPERTQKDILGREVLTLLGLKSLEPFVIVKTLVFGDLLEHVLDSRHHTLKTAEVDVGTLVKLVKDFVSVFFNLVLDVHLSTGLVGLFTGEGIVKTEVVRELLLDFLEFIVVKESIRVGNTKEQPGLSLVGFGSGGIFDEKTTDESTVGGDSSTSGNHDVVSVGVFFGHKHDLTGGSSHLDFVTRRGVAQEVGADTLLGGVFGLEFRAPVGSTTNTEGSSLSGHVITVTRRGDGVKTDRVGFSVLFTGTRRDYTPGLSFPVREVTVVVNDDVASFTSGLRSDNTLGRDNLSSEGSLVLVNIDRNSGLVPVRGGLKEILLGFERSAEETEQMKLSSVKAFVCHKQFT